MKRSESSRRDFLKRSAGLAAVGAIPYFWTSQCARADASKAEKLTMAAIGVGGRGTEIGNQAASLANVVACVDVKRGNAERFAGPLGGKCKVYTDYRKVLDRKDIQADHLRHARSLAHEDRHRGHAGRQGRVLREAPDADHRRGQVDRQGGPRDGPGAPGGHPAAERVRRRILGGGGHRPQRAAGQEAQSHRPRGKGEAGRALSRPRRRRPT